MTIKTSDNTNSSKRLAAQLWNWLRLVCWRKSLWRKVLAAVAIVVMILMGIMYGVAEWYIHDHASQPVELGATFIPNYAQDLGVDPKQTLAAMLEPASQGGLGLKNLRLVSYWNDIESSQGKYDFSNLDWQFALANKYGASVSLAIGLRQPRWPECHAPNWVASEPKSTWQPQLNNFIKATINHYKLNPALQSYQLENEYFMKIFGQCSDFDRSRLVAEAALVKATDPHHPLIISRSDNWVGLPVRQPRPDEFGISIYKRVFDYHFTHRYVEYPLPPWFYSFLAGAGQIITGKDMIIHELQAEPWIPNGPIQNSSASEQAKSFSPERLKTRISYAEATGMKTIELWGAEYWYWMKVKHDDPNYWQIVQRAVEQASIHNSLLPLPNNNIDPCCYYSSQ